MRPLGLAALLVAACGPPGHGPTTLSGGGSTGTTEPASSGSSTAESSAASHSGGGTASGTTGAASTTAGTGTTSDPPVIDLGAPDLGTDGPPVGCQGKIDFVFIIGREDTMETKQEAVLASLPVFLSTIEGAFADFDYHILVANPQNTWGSSEFCPGLASTCPSDGGCAAIDEPNYPCWVYSTLGALTACDWFDGAGVIFPAGKGASNVPCKYPEGRRYLKKGDTNMEEIFLCAARGGYSGGGIGHGWSTVRAVSDDFNGPGGCHEGFLRDDALLVIVWITDYGDLTSEYSPLAWSQLVKGVKGDKDDGIVILGLINDAGLEPRYCKTDNDGSEDRLVKMLSYFQHTMRGSVCMPDYTDFIVQGAKFVLDICDVYVPQ
ncbi:MAG: hypothetical protein R3B09_06530 [Nannocystaceae bacterium]